MYQLFDSRPQQTLPEKIWNINWGLVLLLAVIASIGFAMLYPAATGSWQPWAGKQAIRFGIGIVVMLGMAMVDLRFWLRYYAAYLFWAFAVALLVWVDLHGHTGMGAQRWIDVGVLQLHPSEVLKVALVVVLASYFHSMRREEVGKRQWCSPPPLHILVPTRLEMKHPDPGTAMMLVLAGAAMFFMP